MCGIAGIWEFNSDKKNQRQVEDLVRAMDYRGPDETGFFTDGSFSFGMCRLAIIDLLGGYQPILNESGSVAVVANGEIYNFRELRQRLEKKGHRFRCQSDSEVIVHLYEEKGEDCVEDLRGMFAFALWDKCEKKLLLVRDRLGVKPLYYSVTEDRILFSSELRPILQLGLNDNKINRNALHSFLLFGFVSDPHTMAQDVESLLPGHMVVVKNARIQVKKYWSLAQNENQPLLNENKFHKTKELLNEAVNLRLVSDVPLAVFLSGGIDSTALTALASRRKEQELKTFSLIFNEKEFDESFFSRKVARHFNTDHVEIRLEKEPFLKEFSNALLSMDQPTVDGINTYFISRSVKQAGITVALSGVGGDELFLGYSSFKQIKYLNYYKLISHYIPIFFKSSLAGLFQKKGRKIKKLVLYLQKPELFLHPYFWSRMLFSPMEVALLLDNPLDSVIEFLMREQQRYLENEKNKNEDRFNIQSRLELKHYLGNQLLRDTDVMGMRNALEIRTPFLDHRLVQYILSLPGKEKWNPRKQKVLLTESLKDLLPEEIVQRRKMGFTLPFQKWIQESCRPMIEEELFTGKESCPDVLNDKAVRSVWKSFLNNQETWARPWALFVLSHWITHNKRNTLCAA